ncbi:MAG: DNA polymerase IV [Moraxellaceae bacterium]|nr:DNA polymerase IV [Moraxellaceae bacterium]
MTAPLRRIAHLDMDAFYASVELLRYPQLKGLPVVIGGRVRGADAALMQAAADNRRAELPLDAFPRLRDYVGRGVITTATYAARAYGIGSAMGLMKAAALCPDAILLPVDFDEYRHFSRAFKAEILAVAPLMENRGVDEVYIDFTHVEGGQEEGGRVLAARLQQAIHRATGLTCSVGVAPNKLLAKMASEFNKPNGIAIVHDGELAEKIWPLPCRKINGIGPRTDEKLKALGIRTIGELAAWRGEALQAAFGRSYGAWLHAAAHGQDDRPVVTESEPVSMSRETTFGRDLHAVADRAELGAIFTRLCEQVAADLARKGYVGRTIGIKVRYDDFKSVTRDHSASSHTADASTIRQLAGQCLKRVPLEKRLRLIGVRVGGLVRTDRVAEASAALSRYHRAADAAAHEGEGDGRQTVGAMPGGGAAPRASQNLRLFD